MPLGSDESWEWRQGHPLDLKQVPIGFPSPRFLVVWGSREGVVVSLQDK